jgi:anti-sigma-K factor RskA
MANRHEEHFDDIPAYVLGALDDHEAEALERHLESCPVCREELRRQWPMQSALAAGVPPVPAPPSLKESVMSQVRAEATPAPRRRLPRLLRPAGLAAAAAACLLALAIGFGVARLTENDSSRVVQVSVNKAQMPGASGRLVVSKDDKSAILRLRGMPAPPPGKVYQAWVQRNGRMVSAGVFAVARDGSGSAAIPTSVRNAGGVFVTREPRGGSSSPSEQPVVSAPL